MRERRDRSWVRTHEPHGLDEVGRIPGQQLLRLELLVETEDTIPRQPDGVANRQASEDLRALGKDGINEVDSTREQISDRGVADTLGVHAPEALEGKGQVSTKRGRTLLETKGVVLGRSLGMVKALWNCKVDSV